MSDEPDWPRLTPMQAEQLSRQAQEIRWWREMFLPRLAPGSWVPPVGRPLYGLQLTIHVQEDSDAEG